MKQLQLPLIPVLSVGSVVKVSWHELAGRITYATIIPNGEYHHIDPVTGHKHYFARDDGSPVNGPLYYVYFERESHGYVVPEEITEVVSNGQ